MTDIDEVMEPVDGVATTRLVQVVGAADNVVVSSSVRSRLVSIDPTWVGSIGVTSAGSSPWWTTRVIEHAVPGDDAELWAREASGASAAQVDSTTICSAPGMVANRRGIVRLKTARQLGLDFGLNVTSAFGAEPASRLIERMIHGAWGEVRDVYTAWLRPDSPQVVAAAETFVDDAEWEDSDDAPRWLSMSDLSYRGGGLMGRRARRSR